MEPSNGGASRRSDIRIAAVFAVFALLIFGLYAMQFAPKLEKLLGK